MSDTATGLSSTTRQPEEIVAVPVRHPGRWIATVVILILLAMLVHSLISNDNFGWGTVFDTLFQNSILTGVVHTIELTVLCMVLGTIGGVILAVMRLSPNPILSWVSWLYIWFFRGTPLLVQILFWGYIGALFKTVGLGIPFGPQFVTFQTQSLITVFLAAVLGLALNEAAYMAEIVRAGILSIDQGQTEAAQSLGMSALMTMRRIVLPQAMRVIIPPTGNETISMLKNSALVSVIAYLDLLYAAQLIYSRNYQTIPVLLAASIWYLFLTSLLTIGQYYIERHYSRGAARELPATPIQRLRALLSGGGTTPAADTTTLGHGGGGGQ
ncbi:MAG TPA: amino acid ABC transporter permease [Nocardioidaceae bacterium]|nr:amino acid ABC transporter permease [Nocardioidaceae bacterium]